jgi:DNA-binding NarL/FixJ family response regulator
MALTDGGAVLASDSMALGNIGKTLAGQAIDAVKKNALDAVRAPEPNKPAEKTPEKSSAAPPENAGAVILGQIQAMQRQLKDDQELVVLHHSGVETLRVLEIFVPSTQVLVLAGIDDQNHVTRVIAPTANLQVVCKVKNVAPGTAPMRVNVLTPKPKGPDQSA